MDVYKGQKRSINCWLRSGLVVYGRLASPCARPYGLRIQVSAIQLNLFVTKTDSKITSERLFDYTGSSNVKNDNGS